MKWDSIETAAKKLDLEAEALRARCRRALRKVDGELVAELGMGVVAKKLGTSWRVHIPEEVRET